MPSFNAAPGGAGSGEPSPPAAAPAADEKLRAKAARDTLKSLVDVQNRLLKRYFDLQRVERRLSLAVRPRQPGSGRAIIRQIELERQRLGRDLHTGVGQILAATRLQLETIAMNWPDPPDAVKHALKRISELTTQALDQVRAVSRRLHPPEWQRLTLAEAVRQLWDLSGLPERTEAHIAIADGLKEPDLETKILFYRALQEALSNIAQHSRATIVAVSLESRGGSLVLSVHDNGVGFDAPALWSSPVKLNTGIGLRAVREQAAALGGELRVSSGAEGTRIEVSVPEANAAV